jgi:mannose-1-phosphate guanylyltransferase
VRRFFGDEPFLIVNGDVLYDFDLRELLRQHRQSGAQATLSLRRNPDPRRYGGVVIDRAGWVRSIAGRPRAARGHAWLFTGVHILDPALLDRLPPGVSDSVRDLYIPLLGEGGRIRGVPTRRAWYDFGSPALYLSSHMSILASGFRTVRPRTKLIDPEARVASGARVDRAVIGAGCEVAAGARILGSVLWDSVRVEAGAKVVGSILTSGVRVERGENVSAEVRLTTGGGLLRYPVSP